MVSNLEDLFRNLSFRDIPHRPRRKILYPTLKEKKEIIKLVEQSELTRRQIAQLYNINERTLRRIVADKERIMSKK